MEVAPQIIDILQRAPKPDNREFKGESTKDARGRAHLRRLERLDRRGGGLRRLLLCPRRRRKCPYPPRR